MKGGHHVVVPVTNQRGEDLPVAGKIAEMADGFSKQGITAFALRFPTILVKLLLMNEVTIPW